MSLTFVSLVHTAMWVSSAVLSNGALPLCCRSRFAIFPSAMCTYSVRLAQNAELAAVAAYIWLVTMAVLLN